MQLRIATAVHCCVDMFGCLHHSSWGCSCGVGLLLQSLQLLPGRVTFICQKLELGL